MYVHAADLARRQALRRARDAAFGDGEAELVGRARLDAAPAAALAVALAELARRQAHRRGQVALEVARLAATPDPVRVRLASVRHVIAVGAGQVSVETSADTATIVTSIVVYGAQ